MREATIQRIETVSVHPNADALDIVKVLGWRVITKRGEFKPGDLCVFCEIDSSLPEAPWSEFMRPRGFRVKTIRLRGELSQGIVFPLNILPNPDAFKDLATFDSFGTQGVKDNIGADVSEILGVTHYEKSVPIALRGFIRGNFPTHLLPKTDEIRVQSIPNIFKELWGKWVYATVKCDGTSFTALRHKDDYQVCSRNNSFKLDTEKNDDNVYIKMAEKYNVREKLFALGDFYAIQGEICGPSIQKNRLMLKEHELFLFNIMNLKEGRYLNFKEFMKMADGLQIKTVPYIDSFIFKHTLEDLLVMATGFYAGTKNRREGIVIRPEEEFYSDTLKGRCSLKVLNNEYLEKDEK